MKKVMRIVVASKNRVKIEAARLAIASVFLDCEIEAQGVDVPSQVSDQPKSNEEIFRGANNRAMNARQVAPDADFWIGMENGIEEDARGMKQFGWAVVYSADRVGYGQTGAFYLPIAVADLIRAGADLAQADNCVFGRENSGTTNGTVGMLTRNVIVRTDFLKDAVVLALAPFVHPTLYAPQKTTASEGSCIERLL